MNYIIIFLVSFVTSSTLTPIVKKLAVKYNLVAKLRQDRWHKHPTALLGGIAIYLSSVITICFFTSLSNDSIALLAGGSILFLVGILDDLMHLKPQFKIFAQIIASCAVIFLLKNLPLNIFFIPVAILWIIGITNAFNLLDNMDGLASGIAGITAGMLFASSILLNNIEIASIALILAGSTFGFLPYNLNPAKIFMGDSGSMFLGFSLATLALMGTVQHISNLLITLAIPVLILAVPIFDTSFVALMRMFRGQSVLQGGKDHTSHRLVSLGLSERKTVLLLYVLSILFGLIALAYAKIDIIIVSILAALTLIVLFFFASFLSETDTYNRNVDLEAARNKKSKEGKVILNTIIHHKRRIAEVIIDFFLICISYYIAYLLRFEGKISSANIALIIDSLPWIIIIRLACFSYFGLYKGVWRYIGITDLIDVFKAVSLSSILSIMLLTIMFRFKDYSRVVFIIDWLLLLFLVSGSRILVRILREYFSHLSMGNKRVLIMGAGDTGELLLREIKHNKSLNLRAVGFIDDNLHKIGRRIHGIPILGDRNRIPQLVKEKDIDEILIAIPSSDRENLEDIFKICGNCNIIYREISGIIKKDA